ncbi:hypothetical protein GCM10010530_13810 [Kribbella aluminosa]
MDRDVSVSVALRLRRVAADMRRRGDPLWRVVAQESDRLLAAPETGCAGCGGEIPHSSGRGRPRRYCLKCAPRKNGGKIADSGMVA